MKYFEDFEHRNKEKLLKEFLKNREVIERLCR